MFSFNTVTGYNGSLKNIKNIDKIPINFCSIILSLTGIFLYFLMYRKAANIESTKKMYLIAIVNPVKLLEILLPLINQIITWISILLT